MVTTLEPSNVTTAVPVVPSTMEVAFTTTVEGLGSAAGAVYRPKVEIDPQASAKHAGPETLQVTKVLLVPVTVAVNCCWLLVKTLAVKGETVTVTAAEVPARMTAKATSAVRVVAKRFMFPPLPKVQLRARVFSCYGATVFDSDGWGLLFIMTVNSWSTICFSAA